MRESLHEFSMKIAALFRRRRLEREMAEEMEFHLALRQSKHAAGGLGAEAAAASARREFGSVARWKDDCRDAGRFRFLEAVARDLAFSLRMMRRSPAFTAVALLTLALAIGANTAVFSLIDALLLRPLPVPRADRLTMLVRVDSGKSTYWFGYPLFRYLERHRDAFSSVFGFAGHVFQVRTAEGTERVFGKMVSGDFFSGLGVRPELGRWLTPADDREGGGADGPVVVVSHRFWKRWLGGSAAAIGRKIVLDKVVFTLAGVMPEGFNGADVGTRRDIFIPLALEPLVDAPYGMVAVGWNAWWIQVGARRREGVSPEKADAFVRAISPAAYATNPERFKRNAQREEYVAAESGVTGFSGARIAFRKPLVVLMVLVTLVLFVASLNLASLMMARSAAREREIAARFALGAGRARLIQQFLTETLSLAALGTILGLAVSPLARRALVGFIDRRNDPFQLDAALDGRVLLFTALVAGLATILTGLAPALRSTGRRLHERIRDGAFALRGAERRSWWPRLVLAVEVALSLVLVTSAGLLGASLVRLHRIPAGFEPRGLVLLYIDAGKQDRDNTALFRFYEDFGDALARVPGVERVSFADIPPLSGMWVSEGIHASGQPEREARRIQVGPDYFRAMRTPLLAGREFRWSDNLASKRVAILNRSAARLLFPDRDPLGQTVEIGKRSAEVIGVVGDAKYSALGEVSPPVFYEAAAQDAFLHPSFAAIVRLNGPAAPVISATRILIRRLAPDIPLPAAASMEQQIAESIATERLMAALAAFFALFALFITGIGLYGTLAYATARRTSEIGIRMALGACETQVVALVLKENAAIAIGGCAAGLAASLAASRFIAQFLYGTSPRSPFVLAGSLAALAAIAALASLIPAWRASRIDPIAAIRFE